MTTSPECLCLSGHAAKRCLERGITTRNVEDTVLLGDRIEDNGERTVYARGRMRVVLSSGGMVITAYRQKKHNPKRHIQRRRSLLRKFARGER